MTIKISPLNPNNKQVTVRRNKGIKNSYIRINCDIAALNQPFERSAQFLIETELRRFNHLP